MSYHFKAICDLLFLIFANLVYTGVSHLTPRQVGQEISGCNNPNSCVSVPAPAEEHPDVGEKLSGVDTRKVGLRA